MKIGEFFGTLLILILISSMIIAGCFFIYIMYQDYYEYKILKQECNQDVNKDLCFCYDGACEVKYSCTNEECKVFEKRLCEISTRAKSKDWIWRFCE